MDSMKALLPTKQESLILTTKLSCPFLAETDLLSRPKLDSLFRESRDKQLILLTASAGYGKSTLMAQWFRTLERENVPVAWLTLDEDDNDPGRLYYYLQLTLQRGTPGRTVPATPDNLRKVNRAHGALLAALLEEPDSPRVLFIDEFEVLTDPEAQRLLQLLQQQMPSGRQLVIASRRKPKWGLSKIKLKGALLELSDRELRFTPQEAGFFRTLRSAENLNETLAQRVIEKTEGWIAGMRLALLCFAGQEHPDQWVEKISGAMNEITDFLTEEVYLHLSDEQQQFLLKAAVPNRICAPLCEALSTVSDAQEILESFCTKGLFLQPLDEQRHWYRIHGLVREFLLRRLRQEQPQQVPLLQGIAAQWLATQGDTLEAIHLAFDSGQTLFASQLLESITETLVQQGQLQTLIDLGEQMPKAMLNQNIILMTGLCWAYIFVHDLEKAERTLTQLQSTAYSIPSDNPIHSQLLTMEPMLLVYQDQSVRAAELALENLPKLAIDDHFQRGVLSNIAAYMKQGKDEFEEAQQLQLQARAAHLQSGSTYGLAYSDVIGTLSEHVAGNLDVVRKRYNMIGQSEDYPTGSNSDIARAVSCSLESAVLYELNCLDEADTLLQKYFPIAVDNTVPDIVISGFLIGAQISFAQENFETAYSRLDKAEVAGLRWPLPRLVNAIRWQRVCFALRRGELEAASTFAAKIQSFEASHTEDQLLLPSEAIAAIDLAPILLQIHTGESWEALDKLDIMMRFAHKRPVRVLKILMLQILAQIKIGQQGEARRGLIHALDKGRSLGAVRTLIDAGDDIIESIQALAMEWRSQPTPLNKERIVYIDKLLEAAGIDATQQIEALDPLSEALSDRELEILQLIGTGLKNDEIAEKLFLSINTVKWHLRRAYEKLDVSSRSAALEQCRKRQLIE